MDIATVLGVLRRRVLLIAVAVVAGAAAGYLVSVSQDAVYSSTTQLLLRGGDADAVGGGGGASPTGAEFGAPLPETAADREALVLSGPVLARVERRLAGRVGGRAAAAGLVRQVDATAAAESDIVAIASMAPTAETAALVANTVAEQNIAYRRETSIAKIERALRTVERTLARSQGGAPTRDQALVQLEQRRAALRQAASLQTGDAEVLTRAVPAASPASPQPARDALIGAFAGLLLGIGAALVREQLDRRITEPKDFERAIGLPVLADVPKSRALATTNGHGPPTLPPREAEAFQMLRANLRYVNADRPLNSVLVTSAGVGDGKSTVALNLARADASAGSKVLLIDADIRKPRLASLLGLRGEELGLATLLANREMSVREAVHRIPVVQRQNGAGASLTMDVLLSGGVPPNPSELIASERMRALITEAEKEYDLVVIDTAPAAIVSDPIPLMSLVSAVVVVGRIGSTTSGQAGSLREQLERIDAPAFGAVANFATGEHAQYGYGYYT